MTRLNVYPMALRLDGFVGSDASTAPFYPLGCLTAYARTYGEGVLGQTFDIATVTPMRHTRALDLVRALPDQPAIFLFSSFVWNHEANVQVAQAVKARTPSALTVFGGPHIPRRPAEVEQFFRDHEFVDVCARGEGEITLAELLSTIARARTTERPCETDLSGVAGISFRDTSGRVRQTPDRERSRDQERFPSPYLQGEFETWIEGVDYAFIETNRGCPYGCTFCDWGAATLSKVHKMSDERIFGDIEYLARKKAFGIVICDANFGILARDVEIARYLVRTKEKYGYPRDLAYTGSKTAKPQFLEIVKVLRDADLIKTGQISLQTTDSTVLSIVKRTNIKGADYDRIVRSFHQDDIPASSDMMVGLPGQTFETARADLQFFFDRIVTTVIFPATVMPNAPMSDPEHRKRYGIVVDDEAFVESTFSFSKEEYQRILALCCTYKFFVKVGIAKYLLYFLQHDHGIPAVDFIASWLASTDPRYPLSAQVKKRLLERDYHTSQKHWLIVSWDDDVSAFLFDDPDPFHRELIAFGENEFGVRVGGPDLEAVLSVQQAVLPHKARRFPVRVPLRHDFVSYFKALRRQGGLVPRPSTVAPLREWPPGLLEIPEQPPCESYAFADIELVAGMFELKSSLSVGSSTADASPEARVAS